METNGTGHFNAFIRHAEEWETFADSETVFSSGDSGDFLYAVRTGSVDLVVGETLVETVHEGSVFGEMALTGSHQRSANAIARGETTLVKVDQARFDRVISMNPFLAREFMRLIADRLAAMNERLKSLTS